MRAEHGERIALDEMAAAIRGASIPPAMRDFVADTILGRPTFRPGIWVTWRRGLLNYAQVKMTWVKLKRDNGPAARDRALEIVAAEQRPKLTKYALEQRMKRDLRRLPPGVRATLPDHKAWFRALGDIPPND